MSCSCRQARLPVCELEVDYSNVSGERILPFRISLDLTASILAPSGGQNQRFCYNVAATGEDASRYADLSHLVLGVCDTIPEEEIVNISVVINGEQQEVVFGSGGNVELRTESAPDPPTGCAGLKFDFPLDKVDGFMSICFELTVAREVSGVGVCLFGGNTTAQGLDICGPICARQSGDCPVIGYHRSTVCVPVTVLPFARVGTPVTSCCGAPTISTGSACPQNGASCSFVISQQVCVAVPIEFGARAVGGTPGIQCGEAGGAEICDDCAATGTAFGATGTRRRGSTGAF